MYRVKEMLFGIGHDLFYPRKARRKDTPSLWIKKYIDIHKPGEIRRILSQIDHQGHFNIERFDLFVSLKSKCTHTSDLSIYFFRNLSFHRGFNN